MKSLVAKPASPSPTSAPYPTCVAPTPPPTAPNPTAPNPSLCTSNSLIGFMVALQEAPAEPCQPGQPAQSPKLYHHTCRSASPRDWLQTCRSGPARLKYLLNGQLETVREGREGFLYVIAVAEVVRVDRACCVLDYGFRFFFGFKHRRYWWVGGKRVGSR